MQQFFIDNELHNLMEIIDRMALSWKQYSDIEDYKLSGYNPSEITQAIILSRRSILELLTPIVHAFTQNKFHVILI